MEANQSKRKRAIYLYWQSWYKNAISQSFCFNFQHVKSRLQTIYQFLILQCSYVDFMDRFVQSIKLGLGILTKRLVSYQEVTQGTCLISKSVTSGACCSLCSLLSHHGRTKTAVLGFEKLNYSFHNQHKLIVEVFSYQTTRQQDDTD